jgi:hypothetical protein
MHSTKIALRLRTFRAGRNQPNVEVPTDALNDAIEALESHDKRVTELIRANSENVVLRRFYNAKLGVALEALQKARGWLKDYAENHRAKGTAEAHFKARTNDLRASQLDNAILADHIEKEHYGKP